MKTQVSILNGKVLGTFAGWGYGPSDTVHIGDKEYVQYDSIEEEVDGTMIRKIRLTELNID